MTVLPEHTKVTPPSTNPNHPPAQMANAPPPQQQPPPQGYGALPPRKPHRQPGTSSGYGRPVKLPQIKQQPVGGLPQPVTSYDCNQSEYYHQSCQQLYWQGYRPYPQSYWQPYQQWYYPQQWPVYRPPACPMQQQSSNTTIVAGGMVITIGNNQQQGAGGQQSASSVTIKSI